MICSYCRYAGEQNALIDHREPGSPRALGLLELAKTAHERCNGKCDCQHIVGRTAKAGREPK